MICIRPSLTTPVILSSVRRGTTVISWYSSVYVERMFNAVVAYRVPVIFGSLGGEGRLLVSLVRYFAVTQRMRPLKMICARPFWIAPVTETALPFFTSGTFRESVPLVVRMSRSAVATRLPITAGRPYMELARYCMLDQPVDRPLTSSAQPRAVFPVMVTWAPPLRTLITR